MNERALKSGNDENNPLTANTAVIEEEKRVAATERKNLRNQLDLQSKEMASLRE